jgi:ATP-dependent protease HslVU (ClpYQ) peptidase subunit
VLQYESTPHPLVIQDKHWAIGSGRDFAIMAMHLGKTAAESVELASLFCNDCGNGVDTLELEPKE